MDTMMGLDLIQELSTKLYKWSVYEDNNCRLR